MPTELACFGPQAFGRPAPTAVPASAQADARTASTQTGG